MDTKDRTRKIIYAVFIITFAVSMSGWRIVQAQGNPPGVVQVTPAQMKWEPYGISIERVVIAGDPRKPHCPGTILIKSAPHTKLPPHSLDQERIATVISGTVYVGLGDTWDDSKLVKMTPGSYWVMPAGVSSFKMNEEEAIYQLTVIHSTAPDCAGNEKMPEKK